MPAARRVAIEPEPIVGCVEITDRWSRTRLASARLAMPPLELGPPRGDLRRRQPEAIVVAMAHVGSLVAKPVDAAGGRLPWPEISVGGGDDVGCHEHGARQAADVGLPNTLTLKLIEQRGVRAAEFVHGPGPFRVAGTRIAR